MGKTTKGSSPFDGVVVLIMDTFSLESFSSRSVLSLVSACEVPFPLCLLSRDLWDRESFDEARRRAGVNVPGSIGDVAMDDALGVNVTSHSSVEERDSRSSAARGVH